MARQRRNGARERATRLRIRRMSQLRYVSTVAAAWGFLLLGVAGLVLPILQGVFFLLVGLALLATVSPRAARWQERLRHRYPSLSGRMDKAIDQATHTARRIGRRFNGLTERGAVDRKAGDGS
ncbi:MAG: hypothetical protein RIE31_01410 [Alphaproteobacteria bacterium]